MGVYLRASIKDEIPLSLGEFAHCTIKTRVPRPASSSKSRHGEIRVISDFSNQRLRENVSFKAAPDRLLFGSEGAGPCDAHATYGHDILPHVAITRDQSFFSSAITLLTRRESRCSQNYVSLSEILMLPRTCELRNMEAAAFSVTLCGTPYPWQSTPEIVISRALSYTWFGRSCLEKDKETGSAYWTIAS